MRPWKHFRMPLGSRRPGSGQAMFDAQFLAEPIETMPTGQRTFPSRDRDGVLAQSKAHR